MLKITIPRLFRLSSTLFLLGIATACTAPSVMSPRAGMNHTATPATMNHGSAGHTMDLGPADADFDLRFIDAMVPHHEGAVIMAKSVLSQSQRPELKQLATAMIDAQGKEIAQMQQWRKTWYPKASTTPLMWHRPMGHMMPMDEATMQSMRMSIDLGKADADFDRRFIDAMIPHHEGALAMAKDLQSKTQRPELKQLAQEILTSQQAEIAQMKQWRKAWYGS